MQIVWLVNWNSNNADFQFQTAPTSFINQGVISGLAVTLNQVAVGSALISVTSNGQTWLITFHNTSLVTIDTSGTKKVWIEVTQAKIDNGVSNNEDGTWIAFINTGASYPWSGSYIPLASIASGVITDDRVFISMKAIKRKAMTANRLLYIDASGNEQELPYGTSGQVLTAVNGTTTPIWASPSVDIHGQTLKPALVWSDELIISDTEASFISKKITLSQILAPIGWNGNDGALTISSGTTTLAFDSNGYLEKNYSSITITGGTLTFSGAPTNWWVAVIKCSGKFTMSGWTISIAWFGGVGGGWFTGSPGPAGTGTGWYNVMKVVSTTWGGGWWQWGAGSGSSWVWHFWWFLQWYCWAGGGGSGWQINGVWWWAGGWVIFIEVKESFNFTAGTITAAGTNWTTATGNWWGGWGGWAGAIFIKCPNIIANAWTINVNGGAGWNATSTNYNLYGWGGGGASYSSWWAWWTWWNAWTSWTSNSYGSGWTGWTGASGPTPTGGGGGGGAWFYKIN